MQKNIFFFLVLDVPTYGEGGEGVDLVGTKDKIFPMSLFEGREDLLESVPTVSD